MSAARDPVRLVADASIPDAERQLLRHGVDIAPPRDAEARVWQGLAGALGVTAVVSAAEASAKTITAGTKVTAAAGGVVTGAKIVAVALALAGLVAVGGYLLRYGNDSRPPGSALPAVNTAPSAAVAPPPSPSAVAPAPSDVVPAPDVRRPAPSGPPAPRTTHSAAVRLREETTLIRDARQALRQGDAARALRLLDECGRLFPGGVLEQERERLAIEALSKSGRASQASARAAAFLGRYPDSPHADEIRGLGLGKSAGR